jgi:hypothetical protein
LELVEYLLSQERCYFCHQPLATTVDRKILDVTLHHKNEDREPGCRLLLPKQCVHKKALAHRTCHKRHHMQTGHDEGWFLRKPKPLAPKKIRRRVTRRRRAA